MGNTSVALFCRFSMAPSKGFRMLPFNHVYVLEWIRKTRLLYANENR